jgi:hypothetical protein
MDVQWVRSIGLMDHAGGTGRLVRLHLGLLSACAICTSGFVIEVLRATGGNALSWAYVFEWPFLCGYAIYMWRRLVVEEHQRTAGLPIPARTPRTPRRAGARARAARRAVQEASALEAWNEYLREVNPSDRGAGPAT